MWNNNHFLFLFISYLWSKIFIDRRFGFPDNIYDDCIPKSWAMSHGVFVSIIYTI